MSARSEVRGTFWNAEADPIVRDFQPDFLVKGDLNVGMFGLCVTHNVVQRLLRNTI